MTKHTAIEWTDHSWNPWYGCTKVSAGCDNCYMFREMRQYGRDPETVTRSKTKFREPLKWLQPALVFTCSWSDFFHKAADAWRPGAWQIIHDTPHLTYQILTKRPGRIARHLPADWGSGYPNVWLGTSVESHAVVHRVRQLRMVPARTRFISAEPLIGALDLYGELAGIHWVIVGGESGAAARPMDLSWARVIRNVCVDAGVAVFLKQLGGTPSNKRGGTEAVLDGRTWTEMPNRTEMSHGPV